MIYANFDKNRIITKNNNRRLGGQQMEIYRVYSRQCTDVFAWRMPEKRTCDSGLQ